MYEIERKRYTDSVECYIDDYGVIIMSDNTVLLENLLSFSLINTTIALITKNPSTIRR